jgi:hypothetical protein
LQTINKRLMQESQKAQQEIVDQFKSEMESISLRWSADAKDKAERILNASLNASLVGRAHAVRARHLDASL